MRTQIVYIHGGTAFRSYEAFLSYLKTTDLFDPFQVERTKKWKETIRESFSGTCDVFYPSMPNSQNARYIEWRLWFERYFPYLNGNVILIGHSQGGYFLAKYLSENKVPFPIRALYLVASPFGPDDFGGEDGGDFQFDIEKLPAIEKVAQNIIIVHSTDDTVVPFSHAERFRKTLPAARFMVFKDRGHFLDPEFPEFIEDLQKYV